jgi:hypothetical protein
MSDRRARIDHAQGGGWTERSGVGIVENLSSVPPANPLFQQSDAN